MADLAAIIGFDPAPAEQTLFVTALTHGSHGADNYERLEFLGDRVLGLVIADAIGAAFPDEPEGQMSRRLNALVSGDTCAAIAREVELGRLIRLGKQARDDGGYDSDNILGDVVEALIGAVYRMRGLDAARAMILRLWGDRVKRDQQAPRHPKSALQEWAAANRRTAPEYEIVRRDGPPHAPRFTVEARIPRLAAAQGHGSSKGDAERHAAAALLKQLEQGR